jgi:hypothetical protein
MIQNPAICAERNTCNAPEKERFLGVAVIRIRELTCERGAPLRALRWAKHYIDWRRFITFARKPSEWDSFRLVINAFDRPGRPSGARVSVQE